MSTKRAPLTAQQAYTLAGAYADLVFGTFTPEFIADVATAFLGEQQRQHQRDIQSAAEELEAAISEGRA